MGWTAGLRAHLAAVGGSKRLSLLRFLRTRESDRRAVRLGPAALAPSLLLRLCSLLYLLLWWHVVPLPEAEKRANWSPRTLYTNSQPKAPTGLVHPLGLLARA